MSNLVANKAADELKTEQVVWCQCEERIPVMARELKETTVQCEFLERDNKAKAADLDKALQEAREARSESRATREEIRQAGEIAASKPFLLQTKFGDPNYAPLKQVWSSPDAYWTCRRVLPMRRSFTKRKKGMQWINFFGRNLVRQSAPCC